jgi:hypothetical protein
LIEKGLGIHMFTPSPWYFDLSELL